MNPAWSVVLFTTLAGAAQGLVVTLALAELAGLPMSTGFLSDSLALAVAMLLMALVASSFHLGRPARGWRPTSLPGHPIIASIPRLAPSTGFW